MGVQKVEFGDRTLIDLSDSTVTENTLLAGATAYNANGDKISGSVTVGDGKLTVKRNGVEVGSFTANQTTDKEINIEVPSISGLASTSYVDQKVAGIVDSSPEALNTLKELATALGNDANFATTVATNIGKKVDKVDGKGLSTNDYTTDEKNKLAGIAAGAQKNTITGVKGNSESSYRTGNVNITASNIGLGNVANERQYSANNPPPYPVTSVAGRKGDVTLKYSDLSDAPISVVQDGDNDVAVIGARYAKLNDGNFLVTEDGVKDEVESVAALKSEGIFYIEGTGSTVGKWLGASTRFTEPYDGLAIRYKIPVAGSTTTTLNINNKGEVTVYRFNDTKLTTHFEAGMIVNLIYHANYQGEGTPRWMCSDYDSNTNTYLRVYRRTNTTSNQTTYGKDFPLLVSNTEASKIGTQGSNNTYAAVYGVMWDEEAKVPTLNPSTGEMKAVKFSGEINDTSNIYAKKSDVPISIEDRQAGEHAVINAQYAVLKDGSTEKTLATTDQIPSVPVKSVAGKTGAVTLAKGDVGLSNVDNVRQYSASNPPPTATGTTAGITVVYPAASCTTYTSDSGTCTPLAVQNGAKKFAITRPSSTTNKAIVRYSNTTGDVQNSIIKIEDVTNSKNGEAAQVISVPAAGGTKKMVYGYCTDQTDGTSFIGGLFDASATSFPYNQGLAIGGSSGNLLWKGAKVAVATDIGNGTLTITQNGSTLGTFSANQSGNKTIDIPASGGGGAQLYRHSIKLYSNSEMGNYFEASYTTVSSRSTRYTVSDLLTEGSGNTIYGAVGFVTNDSSLDVFPLLGDIYYQTSRERVWVYYVLPAVGEYGSYDHMMYDALDVFLDDTIQAL